MIQQHHHEDCSMLKLTVQSSPKYLEALCKTDAVVEQPYWGLWENLVTLKFKLHEWSFAMLKLLAKAKPLWLVKDDYIDCFAFTNFCLVKLTGRKIT